MTMLLHKELSYRLIGAVIQVRKDFGLGHKESLYQNALAKELKRQKIPFEREKDIRIYNPRTGEFTGTYQPDFVIDNKIIVEIKAQEFVSHKVIDQLYDYLRNSEYELGYFLNFGERRFHPKRIIYTNDRKDWRRLK